MQAIILAAGRGNRLRPLTDKIPKSLVVVNEKSFLENALEALAKHKEINEVIIVVGYKKNTIKTSIGTIFNGLKITYVDNDEWESTNNIYSLWMAMDHIVDDFILMEGDIYFDHEILKSIFKNRDRNIAFLSKYDYSMSGTVVKLDEKGSKKASKTLVQMNTPSYRINRLIPSSEQDIDLNYSDKYKTVNIYYFTHDFFQQYFKPRLELYVKTHGSSSYYELILGILIYLNTPNIYGHIIDREKWYEVDTENDLEMAKYYFSDNKYKISILENLSGGFWRYDFVDSISITNPYFPTESFYSKLSHELPYLINNYPSTQHKLKRLLSQWYNTDGFVHENILVGNGSTELIDIMKRCLIKKITIPVPNISSYMNIFSPIINCFKLSHENNYRLDEERYVASVQKSNSNYALIANPNNPTSTVTEKEKIIHILENLQGLEGIIVDETLVDFTGNRDNYSVQDLITKYPNLIVLRSLSDGFGISGLRLGYIVTKNEKILAKIGDHIPRFSVNSLAEKFIEMFPRYQNEYDESIGKLVKNKKVFIKELTDNMLLDVIGHNANFLFCKIKQDCIDGTQLRNQLFCDYNIFIKNLDQLNGLNDEFVRISIRKPQVNNKLINALKDIEGKYFHE